MGAMENKSLNVFNTSAVLATPEMSTDDQLERVAGIVAHEYFHVSCSRYNRRKCAPSNILLHVLAELHWQQVCICLTARMYIDVAIE